jgi:uncharacterized membrane protein YjjP (DUF1212 family)
MRNWKLVCGIALMAVMVCLMACAEGYDKESGCHWKIIDGGKAVMITEYIGKKRAVRIPPRMHKLQVTSIGDQAFAHAANSRVKRVF